MKHLLGTIMLYYTSYRCISKSEALLEAGPQAVPKASLSTTRSIPEQASESMRGVENTNQYITFEILDNEKLSYSIEI